MTTGASGGMTPERWQEIDRVLQRVLGAELSTRDAVLAQACAGDDDLRREVESLLGVERSAVTFLERSPIDVAAAARLALGDASGVAESPPESALQLTRLRAALQGRYTIGRELGHGGMAIVYLARDVRHQRDVAIKVLASTLAAQLGAPRFLREIEVAARLAHPHILPLHDSGVSEDVLFYVMPYVRGGSLRERLRRDGALPIAATMRIMRDITLALAHAHRHGVVHRDIKPENVLLNEDGQALVADFGIAKTLLSALSMLSSPGEVQLPSGDGSTTTASTGGTIGTPAYMAPEQAEGNPATDHRADLYALGVVAYEMLTGAHPFGKRAAPGMLVAHRMETPAPLATRREGIPEALSSLVERLLAKRPSDRPANASDVVRALEQIDLRVEPAVASSAAKGRSRLRRIIDAMLGDSSSMRGRDV